MTKVKKLLLLLMLAAAFIWLVYTIMIYWDYVWAWGQLEVGPNILASQTILLVIKNVPTLLSIIIAKVYWY